MRSLLLLIIILWGLAKTFSRPWLGVCLWTWVSLMSPHRMTWGIASTFPIAQAIAGITLISLFTGKQEKLNIWSRESIVLLMLIIWICISTVFAINPDAAKEHLVTVLKIQLFVFLTLALISDKEKLNIYIWVVALSVGFYGIKGGIFTIMTGGGARVWGPPGTFIGGNNELALALLMVIPLMNYLRLQTKNKWIGRALIISMLLSAVSILGTQSRGAFLGIAAIGFFFWLKSKQKMAATMMVGVISMIVLFFMPQTWWDRMNTIQTYEEDASAMGRINAWTVAYNVANDRITGGGAGMFIPVVFREYAPNPEHVADSHSIYFEILGEQGWVGFTLYLILAFLTWRTCSKLSGRHNNDPNMQWAQDLGRMLQVGLIGYFVSGAFLGLAYLDLYYNLVAIAIIAWKISLISKPGKIEFNNISPAITGGTNAN